MQRLMQKHLKEQEMAETKSYHQGQLGIQNREQARAEKLLPYLIQEHINKSKKEQAEQDLFQEIFGKGNNRSPSTSNNPIMNSTMEMQNNPSVSQNMGNDNFNNMMNGNTSQRQKININQNPINLSQAQENNQSPTKSLMGDLYQRLHSGEEITIRPASPEKERWDRAPGSTVMGIKIPDIKSKVIDGIRYDTYPSGKVIAQKEGPSTEEKAKISLNAAEDKEQAKANVKQGQSLIDTGKSLVDYSDHVEALANLYEKKKNVSGLLPGLRNKANLGSEDSATFMAHSTPMVGKLGKDIATRGGAYVSSLAQAGKPNLYQPDKYNIKMIDEQARGVYKSYQRTKEAYEELFPGKKYPVKLPKFYDKFRVKAPNGLTYIKTQKEAEKLIKKYPNAEIVGNIYE